MPQLTLVQGFVLQQVSDEEECRIHELNGGHCNMTYCKQISIGGNQLTRHQTYLCRQYQHHHPIILLFDYWHQSDLSHH